MKVRGFKRKLTLANIDAAVKAVTSVVAAKKIIRDFSPDVVIGTGGYVSWPTVKAAAKLGVPTLIQEQNAFPGVTQRMLAKYADKICVSFEESRKFFDDAVQDKILLTGNPVAASAFTRAQAREKLGLAPDALYVVSSGGSLGAEKVNEYVFEVIGAYTGPKGIRHIHSVGRAGWEKYSRIAGERGFDRYGNIRIAEYIYDMQLHLAAADIVIGRAGAMTLAENACMGKASILIPSPNVTNNHQEKNARVLEAAGGAKVLLEGEFDAQSLLADVKELLSDDEKLSAMSAAMTSLAAEDATERICGIILDTIHKE